MNDWLVEEHKNVLMVQCQICLQREECRRNFIVEALKKTKGDTDVDTLIKKMEGMEFDTPKGKMKFREKPPSDADAVFYHIEKQDGVDYPVPVLERELTMKETEPPVQNK